MSKMTTNKPLRSFYIALCLVVVCFVVFHKETPSLKLGHSVISTNHPDISVIVNFVENGQVVRNHTENRDGKIIIFLEIQQDLKEVKNKTDPCVSESETEFNRTRGIMKSSHKKTVDLADDNQTAFGFLSYANSAVDSIQAIPLTTGPNPYKINNKGICRGVKDILFIVLVHTATDHFERRRSFRQTWANISLYKNIHMRVVFLLGLPKKRDTQSKLEKENKMYKDLVQGNFLDSYHNLTHKGVLGLRWITENCRQAKFIVKVDDDVFVNTLLLIENVLVKNMTGRRQILGHVKTKDTAPVLRTGKWKVDKQEFRNVTHYPFPLCKGYFVVMTRDIIGELYEAAKFSPFFWIDDVYLFGILPFKVGNITHISLKGLSLGENKTIECFNSTLKKCPLLVGNAHSDGIMTRLWQIVVLQYKEQALTYLKPNLSL